MNLDFWNPLSPIEVVVAGIVHSPGIKPNCVSGQFANSFPPMLGQLIVAGSITTFVSALQFKKLLWQIEPLI